MFSVGYEVLSRNVFQRVRKLHYAINEKWFTIFRISQQLMTLDIPYQPGGVILIDYLILLSNKRVEV